MRKSIDVAQLRAGLRGKQLIGFKDVSGSEYIRENTAEHLGTQSTKLTRPRVGGVKQGLIKIGLGKLGMIRGRPLPT